MSVKKFKFVSPGVSVTEIDQSQVPQLPGAVGPVIIRLHPLAPDAWHVRR